MSEGTNSSNDSMKNEQTRELRFTLSNDAVLLSELGFEPIFEDIDEDCLLGDEKVEDGDCASQIDEMAILLSPKFKQPRKDEYKPEQPRRGKKILLDRSVFSHLEDGDHAAHGIMKGMKSDEPKMDKSNTIIKLSSVSEAERLQLRAKKFGIPMPGALKTKMQARAIRFGLTVTPTSNK